MPGQLLYAGASDKGLVIHVELGVVAGTAVGP